MATRSFRPSKRKKPLSEGSVDAIVKEARDRSLDYRSRSLALHGWICARCAREFDAANLHLLTVHHKDGNHNNNPSNGRNWENLCVDCHEAEHTKEMLADYIGGSRRSPRRG